jgi:small-conductance mechanosensitive channel
MDVGGMRKLAARLSTRPMRIGAAACMLLAVPLIWTIRQSGLTREALDRAAAAERAAEKVRSDLQQSQALLQAQGLPPKDPAVRRSHHNDPKEIERVKQLYAEIDGLTRIQERLDQQLGAQQKIPTKNIVPAPIRPR